MVVWQDVDVSEHARNMDSYFQETINAMAVLQNEVWTPAGIACMFPQCSVVFLHVFFYVFKAPRDCLVRPGE